MSRNGWGVLVVLALLLAGCSTVGEMADKLNPFSRAPTKAKAADLPNFTPTAELVVRWQAQVGASGEFVFTPAVFGETVFAAAKDGTLVRIENGREVWRTKSDHTFSAGVGSDGRIVVVATPKGEVLAFSATDGKPLWQARVSSEVLAAPAIAGDLVIVRSNDHRIFAFAAADGQRRWLYQRSTPALALRLPAGVLATAKAIYAGFPGGKLAAIAAANGAALWEASVAMPRGATELERLADVVGEPVLSGNDVCAVAYQGRLACFEVDSGRSIWARDASSLAGLTIGERSIVLVDEKDQVLAYERNGGASLWKQEGLLRRALSRPLILQRRVIVGDFQGYVHLLAGFDGAFAARIATDGSPIKAPPQPYREGVLVQTQNGGLFALAIR